MPDVIVLIPGILGSVLVKDGRELWGATGESVIGNLLTFGRALNDLKLEPGVGHSDPKDGVSAPRLLPRLRMIPTFWKADGYGRLTEQLLRRFTLTRSTQDQPGNLVEFPYDWRLSNEFNAQRLADTVIKHLELWRSHTKNDAAKLIFICHSMGGLVARWFLEKLGGREMTRSLITVGTPYRGSVNALNSLVNGLFLGLGPVGISLDQLVRSFPSVYQLLPTYPCLDVGNGELQELSGVDLPNTCTINVEEGLTFHRRISAAVDRVSCYEIFAIKGIDQPTSQTALIRNGRLETIRSYKGKDHGGDGTVPRPSAHPPEWKNEVSSVYASQTHAMLQSTESILTQVFGILTGNLGRFMGGTHVSVDIPEMVSLGSSMPIEVTSKDGDSFLPLHVIIQGEDGTAFGSPTLMRAMGDGRYHSKIDGLPQGAWRITVQSATPARPIEAVSDWMLVLDSDTA